LAFYKRSVFLVDPKFQLNFALIIAGMILCASVLYPIILVDYVNDVVEKYPNLATELGSSSSTIIIYLLVVQAVFVLVCGIICIFLTHKIAGPLYKLKTHLSGIRHGEPITPLAFRTSDYFSDVAEEVSLFLDTVRMNQEKDFLYLDEVSAFVGNLSSALPEDKKPVINEITRRLQEIQDRYKRSL
jgi:hypothetical protein